MVPTAAAPQDFCLDKNYDFDEVCDIAKEPDLSAHNRARGNDAMVIMQAVVVKVRRWVVARANSCMNRLRRIVVRWGKIADIFIAMLRLAYGVVTRRETSVLK